MRFRIKGREYEADDALTRPRLNDLIAIHKATGMDAEEVMASLSSIRLDALMSSSNLLALGVMVWLARRRAGENLTLEQACDFDLQDEFEVIQDEPAPVVEAVPTLPGSDPATVSAAPRARSRSGGPTSRRASTRAS